MDPDYKPDDMEERTIFGVRLKQTRNQAVIDHSYLNNVVSETKQVSLWSGSFKAGFFFTA